MKTICIGDIHGRDTWKQIVTQENADRIIFIGDYFDSFTIKAEKQMNNFLDIIAFKESSSNKEVILLIGNHDIHYFPEIKDTATSGYQERYAFSIKMLMNANRKHLQMAYQMGEFIFTHAGVSSEFMDNNFEAWTVDTMVEQLNELFKYQPQKFVFNRNGLSSYGDDTFQTPIWIRPKSLMAANKKTLRKKIIQIVGHTQVATIDISKKTTGGRYYFIDCPKEYLVIENNKITKGIV